MIKCQKSDIFQGANGSVFPENALGFYCRNTTHSSASAGDAGLRWLNAASVYCFPPALHKHALSAGTLHSICRFRSVSLKGQQSRDWCLENKLRRRWMQSKAPHVYWWPPFRVSLSSIFHSPREGHCSETEFRAGTFERIRSGLSCKTRRQHYIYTHKKFFLSI